MKHIFLWIFLFIINISLANGQQKWIHRESGTGNMLTAIAFGGQTFVAAGEEGIILTSADGIKWKPQQSPVTALINAVTYGNGKFVAVTADGNIITSTKGSSWSVAYTDENGSTLRAVAFCGNMFVAVGNNTILISSNGIQWSEADLPDSMEANLYGVAYGNATTVAIGSDGSILFSKNKRDWQRAEADSALGFISIAYGKNKFIAVTEEGRVFMSPDGLHWSSKNMLSRYPLTVSNLLFANNIFIAVGSPGLMAISADGKTWKELLPDTSGDLLSTGFGNKQFAVSGSMGLIMISRAATH